MSDTPTEPTTPDATPTETPAPPASTETDWKAKARLWEDRAKSNSKAAERLAELEEAQKTEAQKLTERAEAAERRAAELEAKAVRAEVAAEKGVPAHLLIGNTKEELIKHADALLEFRGEAAQTPPQNAPYVPAEGRTPATPLNGSGIEDALRSALGV